MAERRPIVAPTIMPGGGFFERLPPRPTTDLDRAAAEYGTARSPYADLQSYLLDQPVFDRGPIRTPSVTTGLTRLDRPDFSEGDIKQRFTDVFEQQREAEKEDRKDQRTKIQATQQSEMIDQRKTNKPPKNFESSGNDTIGGGFNLESFDPR